MPFHGVIAYEIIRSGGFIILNGIYCNNTDGGAHDAAFEINNEVAKKRIDSNADDPLLGAYELRYIDADLVNGTLKITSADAVYHLEWFDESNNILFTGFGLMAGPNHLAVSYS